MDAVVALSIHGPDASAARPGSLGDLSVGLFSREDIATALTARREYLGLSIRAVARCVDLPPATVGGYFSGRYLPPATRPEVLEALLLALQIDVRDRGQWIAAITRVRRQTRAPRRVRSTQG